MRSETEIRQKFRELYYKEFSKRKESYLSVRFLNCKYNIRYKVKDFGSVGFCKNDNIALMTKRKVFVCNEDICAEKCQYYDCLHTEATIQEDFDEIIKDPARCGYEYPKIAILIWMLHDEITFKTRSKRLKEAFSEAILKLFKLFAFSWF